MLRHKVFSLFCSTPVFSSVVNVRIKRRAELSTNHHLVVCFLRGLNHRITRKRFRAQRAYRMRNTFASKVASRFRELLDYTETLRLSGVYLNQQSLHLQLLVVFANVWEAKWVVRKELLGGTKKLKKLSVQEKLRSELG